MTLTWLTLAAGTTVALLYILVVPVHALLQQYFAYRRNKDAKQSAGSVRRGGKRLPAIDVIVPCYNEAPEQLEACCASLAVQDYPGPLRVFLVDDGSDNADELLEVYKRYGSLPGWTVQKLPENVGKRKAQDAAFERCAGELVVMVDSDTQVAPDGISRLAAAFRRKRVGTQRKKFGAHSQNLGAATGSVRAANPDASWLSRAIHERYRLLSDVERAAQSWFGSVLCCAGPFSIFKRSALDAVWDDYQEQSLFGTRCINGDDLRLTNLVLASGLPSVYVPEAKAYTQVPATIGGYIRQQLRWNRSHYRELLSMYSVVMRRPFYMRFDLTARTLPPLALIIEGGLAASAAFRTDWQTAGICLCLIGIMVWTSLLVAAFQSPPGFVLCYGLVYLGLLVPLRVKALATLKVNRWETRTPAQSRQGQSVPA